MSSAFVKVNSINLSYECFGDPSHPKILLIMGSGAQGLFWPTDFCRSLASLGYQVIRYDHRDTGLSSNINFDAHPYDLNDFLNDAIGLLNALKIEKAHIIGASMGGYIAQLMALEFPERVLSLTLLTSSTDLSVITDVMRNQANSQRKLPLPANQVITMLTGKNKSKKASNTSAIDREVASWKVLNGDKAAFDEHYWRKLAEEGAARTTSSRTAINHLLAIALTKFNIVERLISIQVPVLVIHGDSDPLLPLAHGESIANAIPSANLLIIKDMGHMLAPQFWPEIIAAIKQHLEC